MEESKAEHLLAWLLLSPLGDGSPEAPVVSQIGLPAARRWFGTLEAISVPVHVTSDRSNADGCVEVMPVGAGTSEVKVCLAGAGLLARARGWSRLQDLAERAADEIVRTLATAPPTPQPVAAASRV